MSENKMAEVAKLLGVELGEEFIVETDKLSLQCKLTKDGIYGLHIYSNIYTPCNVDVCKLITVKYKIKKKPWKAKLNEDYFIPVPTTGELYKLSELIVSSGDNEFYERGLMCKTKEQAIKTAKAMIKVAREMQGFEDNKEE